MRKPALHGLFPLVVVCILIAAASSLVIGGSRSGRGEPLSSEASTAIRLVACGDGALDTGEWCDDGNALDDDACRSNCVPRLGTAADFRSDDFDACSLGAAWTAFDPFGVGSISTVGAGSGNAVLELAIPAGTAYDAWSAVGNGSLRVTQPALNADLDIEARLETVPPGQLHDVGILVEQDPDDWLRFDVFRRNGVLEAFIGSTAGGFNTQVLRTAIDLGSPTELFLRLARQGDLFTFTVSPDRVNWTSIGSVNRILEVRSVGVYAASAAATAFTVRVDYVFNLADPIDPEDGGDFECDDDDLCTDDACDPPSGTCTHTPNFDGATECCDPATGATEPDIDGDGDGASPCDGDCDDADPGIVPGTPELCDGIDNDCDGVTDDTCACGDGVVTGEESCDDAGESASCDMDCTAASCGDRNVNTTAGESCDEGGLTAGCDGDCTAVVCGDEYPNPLAGEACDDGGASVACDVDCTLAVCGDGTFNPAAGEACDTGGASATCDADCTPAICGDRTTNPAAGEACDTGGASASCDADCTLATCGDGTHNPAAGEACDTGGDSASCDANCTPAACGDGTYNPAAGEACDTGGASASCDADCTPAACGDGTLNPTSGEVCDTGGASDTCDGDCTPASCGDGTLNPHAGERCDDGNAVDDDNCTNACFAHITNVLRNHDFSAGKDAWQFFTDGVANFNAFDGTARIKIIAPGDNVQLFQTGFAVEPETTYVLRFRAKNTTGANVQVELHDDGRPFTWYGLAAIVDLTTRWETFELQFRTVAGSVRNPRLKFYFAPFDTPDSIYVIDDVELYATAADCGDGDVDPGEECDEAGASPTCDANCTLVRCGDGTTNPAAGEECDDGNAFDDDRCSNACMPGGNILANGDFADGLAPWSFYSSGTDVVRARDGEACVEIRGPANNVQLLQRPLALRGDTEYVVMFDARNNRGRNVGVQVLKHHTTLVNYGLRNAVVDLTTMMETHTIQFRTTPGDKTDARLSFVMTGYSPPGTLYCFDNVRLYEAPNGAAQASAP